VRTGALSFGVGAPVAAELARPAPATLSVPFSSPYVYNGGGLAVLVRHSASGQSAPGLDALTGSVGVNAFAGATADATTGVAHPAPIVHLDVRSAAAIPVASATSAGPAQISTLLGTAPATMQMIIGADQLASIPPGSTIDGLSFRVRGATAWPAVSTITSRLDVTLATPGASPGSMFASISQSRARPESRATLVRSGPWAVSKDAFNASATIARRWSPMIRFDRPYTYVGGGLHVTIVSAGFPTAAGSAALDAQAAGSAGIQAGIATVIDADSTSVDAPAPIMRVHFTPGVARPASAGLVAGEFSGSGVFSSVGGRLQYVIAMDDLPAFASPLPVTGLAFRAAQEAAGGGGGPAREVRIANFRVRVGPAAISPDAISARFDENAGDAGTKLVRSGALTIPAFALRSSGVDGVPAPASFVIPFDVPYLWRAGPLLVTLEAEGVDGAPLALESIAPSGAIGAVYAEDGVSERGQVVNPPVVVLMHAKHLWRSPADIADDQGNAPPTGVNNGVTESDYNVFVRVYFDNSIVADIADDQGNALPSELPNNGVTEGDYNLFFRAYFGL
ncbi:MAG: hypothetical protein K2X32_06480, partial [Phycisphaerales bacterium]|nr:hypothetical protein [Phycisphaerales bacterium]